MHQKVKVDKKMQIGVRLIGAVLPFSALTFGLAIKYDYLPIKIDFFTDTMLVFFGLFTALGVATLTLSNRPRVQLGIRIFGSEAVFMLYILMVTGFDSFLSICWLILAYESYRVFRERGMYLSFLVITATFILDITLQFHELSGEIIYNNVVTLLLIIGTSIFIISMTKAQAEKEVSLKISEQKERLERGRLETLINNIASSIISFDTKGTVQRFNAASLALLDTHISADGTLVDAVVTLTDKDGTSVNILEYAKTLSSATTRDDLYYHYPASNETIRLEVIVSPIHTTFVSRSAAGSSDSGYILILRDITKEKSLEEERESFISVVSHELRTPIAIAEGSIGNAIFMNDHDKLTPALLSKSLESVHSNITALSRMINDLNTLSRAESTDDEQFELLDVAAFIDDLYKKHSADVVQKGLQLNIDRSPHLGSIMTSRLYLTDILSNLISNAIKYTASGSITITAKQSDSTLTLSVKDTGNGIAKTDLAKIFDKFYRSEDYRTRETGGNGLGLYIASRLASKLNASIEVTSRYEHGSEFSVTLPVAKDS